MINLLYYLMIEEPDMDNELVQEESNIQFDYPKLLMILIINANEAFTEKFRVLFYIILGNKKLITRENIISDILLEVFRTVCFYSIKLTTFDDEVQD